MSVVEFLAQSTIQVQHIQRITTISKSAYLFSSRVLLIVNSVFGERFSSDLDLRDVSLNRRNRAGEYYLTDLVGLYSDQKMAMLESYQLTHPELLSENALREVLENCCIEISMYQNLCKSELIDIYKRIAMPLPQRTRSNSKDTDNINGNHHRPEKNGPSGGDNQSNTSLSTSPNAGSSHNTNKSQPGRLKPPVNGCSPKKIKISNSSKSDVECSDAIKRKNDDNHNDSNDSPSKKRQKITWP